MSVLVVVKHAEPAIAIDVLVTLWPVTKRPEDMPRPKVQYRLKAGEEVQLSVHPGVYLSVEEATPLRPHSHQVAANEPKPEPVK